MLTINNPEHAKQRAKVKPLTLEDEQKIVLCLNMCIDDELPTTIRYLQRLIHNYENYRHFFEVVGGWEGYEKIVSEHDKLSGYINTLYFHNEIQKNAEQILKDK